MQAIDPTKKISSRYPIYRQLRREKNCLPTMAADSSRRHGWRSLGGIQGQGSLPPGSSSENCDRDVVDAGPDVDRLFERDSGLAAVRRREYDADDMRALLQIQIAISAANSTNCDACPSI
jgi:hypothetical protein